MLRPRLPQLLLSTVSVAQTRASLAMSLPRIDECPLPAGIGT